MTGQSCVDELQGLCQNINPLDKAKSEGYLLFTGVYVSPYEEKPAMSHLPTIAIFADSAARRGYWIELVQFAGFGISDGKADGASIFLVDGSQPSEIPLDRSIIIDGPLRAAEVMGVYAGYCQ
jgi:hypothetical protein